MKPRFIGETYKRNQNQGVFLIFLEEFFLQRLSIENQTSSHFEKTLYERAPGKPTVNRFIATRIPK